MDNWHFFFTLGPVDWGQVIAVLRWPGYNQPRHNNCMVAACGLPGMETDGCLALWLYVPVGWRADCVIGVPLTMCLG